MSLQTAFTASKIIESLENYAKSDKLESGMAVSDEVSPDQAIWFYGDKNFWHKIISNPQKYWNKEVVFEQVGLSEWISRVPGLYYSNGSENLRRMAEGQVELTSGKWKHFRPSGKSQKVLGGVGSIYLKREGEGRLVSISFTNNSSTGIPVLITEEVWEQLELAEGTMLNLRGRWCQMDNEWASRFVTTRHIPRGYVLVNNPSQIEILDRDYPTIFHPFTIMEYEKDNGKFFDFVFVTADSKRENYRQKVAAFFEDYKNFDNRFGKYLIEPCIHEPLITDETPKYGSPEEIRAILSGGEESHLDLMMKRIHGEVFNGRTIDKIKIAIDTHLDLESLKRIGTSIGVPENRWFSNKSLVDESAALLEICMERKKLDELVDALNVENDRIFE